ncbi:MAG: DUF3570 domain-containing protein [Chlorobiaceae bacterium]|nr:DUF3570 domain-containing protein [Chlorobiaceae bacterium]
MQSIQGKHGNGKSRTVGALLASAAMLLPPVRSACADAPPEQAVVSVRYLNYHDSQKGDTDATAGMSRDRIDVQALSLYGMAPIAGKWSIAATFTEDSVSGASPAYHGAGFPADSMSGASAEIRYAGDLSVTRYFSRGTLSAGASYSEESDYISRGCSLNGTWSTESRNTTLSFGTAYSSDTLFLNNPAVVASKKSDTPGRKRVLSGLLGVTQVLSQNDIMQLTVTYAHGEGYYSDPYKDPDERPGKRRMFTFMTRWNHHFDGPDGTARLSYRYYGDSFGIVAHTFGAEYVQPLPNGWEVTPMVRFYSQSAADFYVPTGDDPQARPSVPAEAEHYSADQRLSSFGAFSYGVRVARELGRSWTADVQYESYRQRSSWCISGDGDPGIPSFTFRSVQLGVTRKL